MNRLLAITNVKDFEGALIVEGDAIAAVHVPVPETAETFDAKGACLAPGIVDLGVFAVDKAACIIGGITRVALMPDQSAVLDNPGLIQRAALAAKPDLWVHPIAAATRGLVGSELAEYGLMREAGAKAVATGRSWIADTGIMTKALAYAGSLGMVLISHGEDAGLTEHAVATASSIASRLGLASAPARAEALALARDIALVEETGAAIHFRQVTTREGLNLVRAAKAKGLPVTCGITPNHLFLSDVAIADFRTFARLSPPLRSEADRQACLAAIKDGTIDVISSGHDPRGPEAKRLPFADAEPGASGLETLLALSLGLVRDGVIDVSRLFQLLATNPAKILGLDCGEIAVGKPADLMLYMPDAPWIIDGDAFVASAGNTPFDKMPTQGKVVMTMKGGGF